MNGFLGFAVLPIAIACSSAESPENIRGTTHEKHNSAEVLQRPPEQTRSGLVLLNAASAGSGGTDANGGAGGAAGGSEPDTTAGGSGGAGGASGASGAGGSVTGSAGNSGSGGNAGETADPEPIPCEKGLCCIQGKEYFPQSLDPSNSCQHCDPKLDQLSFSPVPEDTPCGTGCLCKSGDYTETSCADGVDNDNDQKSDCADVDCAGQSCKSGANDSVYVTRDVQVSTTNEGLSELEGQPTLLLATNPHGAVWGTLEFSNLPAEPAVNIIKATLVLHTTAVSTARIQVKGPQNQVLANPELVPDAPDPTRREFDITSLVRAWLGNTESTRFLTIHRVGYGTVSVHASESDGSVNQPRIELVYDATCSAQRVCPEP